MRLFCRINSYMAVFLTIAVLGCGLILMAKGGDIFVDSAVRIAKLARVPEFLIGATVVAVGTTLPELLTSLTAICKGVATPAAMQELTDVAVGNAVGSMACNIGLILALSFLLKPYPAGGREFAVKGVFLLICTGVLCAFACFNGRITALEGGALLALFAVYIAINIWEAVRKSRQGAHGSALDLTPSTGDFSAPAAAFCKKDKPLALAALFLSGAACVAAGALFTVESVCRLCANLGIQERIISVTVVAVGTSLPELVTAVTSARKGTGQLSLGNILGANVINGTLLLGLSAMVAGGLDIDPITRGYTLWFALALAAALVIPLLVFRRTSRLQGVVLGGLYIAAMVFACA